MDTNIAPVWSLFRDGVAPSTSKKSCLETAIAIAYLSALMAQREDNGAIYKPFLSQLAMIQSKRRIEFQSWFHNDAPTLGLLEGLWDDPHGVSEQRLTDACIGHDVSEWAMNLLPYLALAYNWYLGKFATGSMVPFYGLRVTGDLYQTPYAVPFRESANDPLTGRRMVFPDFPFFRITNYVIRAAKKDMQEYAVQNIMLNSVHVQTEPLRRMLGDTVITALWEDMTTGITETSDLFRWDRDEAFPQVYCEKAGAVTGLEWLNEVTTHGDDLPITIEGVESSVRSRSKIMSRPMLASNPNITDGMSMESLSAMLVMADDPDDDDSNDTTTTSTDDTQTPTDQTAAQPASDTPASTDDSGSDAGEAAATSTDTDAGTPADTSDPNAAVTPAQPEGDTSTGDPSEPSPDENNIAGLSFDTSGENREDYLYRRGVLALANKINDDMDFPVSDEVRNLLKAFVEVWLYKVSIKDVRDYMKKLGLQTYLEAVSF